MRTSLGRQRGEASKAMSSPAFSQITQQPGTPSTCSNSACLGAHIRNSASGEDQILDVGDAVTPRNRKSFHLRKIGATNGENDISREYAGVGARHNYGERSLAIPISHSKGSKSKESRDALSLRLEDGIHSSIGHRVIHLRLWCGIEIAKRRSTRRGDASNCRQPHRRTSTDRGYRNLRPRDRERNPARR
jgi:hypothetical protein